MYIFWDKICIYLGQNVHLFGQIQHLEDFLENNIFIFFLHSLGIFEKLFPNILKNPLLPLTQLEFMECVI